MMLSKEMIYDLSLICSFARQNHLIVTWWGQAHGPWFLSPALGEYERVRASAEYRDGNKIDMRCYLTAMESHKVRLRG